MPLNKEEKDYIVNKVVEILKSPLKDKLIENLKTRVFNNKSDDDEETSEEVIYAVIQAIDEIYG
ncbi:MAG: hypothetical protein JXR70_08235 [Spirochaetales bacterium]|nr:hypothetical protein [Spirochaetales bacterium]